MSTPVCWCPRTDTNPKRPTDQLSEDEAQVRIMIQFPNPTETCVDWSVLRTGSQHRRLSELSAFCLYTLRQLSNLGSSHAADVLAQTLVRSSIALESGDWRGEVSGVSVERGYSPAVLHFTAVAHVSTQVYHLDLDVDSFGPD